MKKLKIFFVSLLLCITSMAYANFNFQLNNSSTTKLSLINTSTRYGHLYLPFTLEPKTVNAGHSTSSDDHSIGKFKYGIDYANYCEVMYEQTWGMMNTTKYKVHVLNKVGKINCKVTQDHKHKSNVLIDYSSI